MIRLVSNAGKPPQPDEELLEIIDRVSKEEISFEDISKIIKEYRERKRKIEYIPAFPEMKYNDRLTI
jgi:hypothetical protein